MSLISSRHFFIFVLKIFHDFPQLQSYINIFQYMKWLTNIKICAYIYRILLRMHNSLIMLYTQNAEPFQSGIEEFLGNFYCKHIGLKHYNILYNVGNSNNCDVL